MYEMKKEAQTLIRDSHIENCDLISEVPSNLWLSNEKGSTNSNP